MSNSSNNVKMVKLGEVFKVSSGGTPSRKRQEYYQGGNIPWIKTGDLKPKIICEASEYISQAGLDGSSAKLFPQGSVLIAMYGATIGACSILDIEAATNQACCAFLPTKEVIPEYLFYYLASIKNTLIRRGVGGAQPNISGGILKDTSFPLVPLPEQKRIAEILDGADEARRKRRENLSLYDDLIRSLFLKTFGDPVSNPMGWEMKPLTELSNKMTDGPFGSNLKSVHYRDNGVRVIRLQNIGTDKFVDDNKAFIAEEHYQSLPRHHCHPRDVIIGTLGDPNLRACLIPDYLDKSLNKADCILFRANAKKIHYRYICSYLNSAGALHLAQGLLHGQTRVRVSMGQLKQLPVAVPPVQLQKEFAEQVKEINAQKTREQALYEQHDDLFNTLLQRAFKGEL